MTQEQFVLTKPHPPHQTFIEEVLGGKIQLCPEDDAKSEGTYVPEEVQVLSNTLEVDEKLPTQVSTKDFELLFKT
jgi:hypothetical protein